MDQARQILSETAGDQPTPQLIHVMDREIEEFHLVLKSGCQIEKLRLETWERLEKAVRVNSSVAARIVWLREVARATPEAPAKPVFYFPGPPLFQTLRRKPRSRSACTSATSSSPTEIRTRPSPMPARSRSAGVNRP